MNLNYNLTRDPSGQILFQGLRVQSSPYAVQDVPIRQHTLTHPNRLAAHRRIQKKWVKRFGTRPEPAILTLGNKILIVHPSILKQMEAELERQDKLKA